LGQLALVQFGVFHNDFHILRRANVAYEGLGVIIDLKFLLAELTVGEYFHPPPWTPFSQDVNKNQLTKTMGGKD